MRNRYDDLLQQHHAEILATCPYYPALTNLAGEVFAGIWRDGQTVLEIGCGEGHTARPLLERTGAEMDLLDASRQMLGACKRNLLDFASRLCFYHCDAAAYLEENDHLYDIIVAGWMFHNFSASDRERLLRDIYANLRPGGTFMLMDKVYPGPGTKRLLERQLARYRFLPQDVRRAITFHERQDASNTFRMAETPLLRLLKEIGFVRVAMHDRVERDIVLTARRRS